MEKLSWREKYSSTLLLLIGIVYLFVWILSFFTGTSEIHSVDADKLVMSKSELLTHFRTLLTILFSLAGSYLFFRKKRLGWMLGFAVLLVFLTIAGGGLYQVILMGEPVAVAVVISGLLLLLTAFLFLLLPKTRRKFRITPSVFLMAFGFAILLGIFYFLFQ
jgi:hypothetical protein